MPMGRKRPDLMQTSSESLGLVACLELAGESSCLDKINIGLKLSFKI